MRFTERAVANVVLAAAVATPVATATPAMAQTKAAAADPVFCPYVARVDPPATAISVVADNGGAPSDNIVGSIANGQTVTAYRDITAQTSNGIIWRKLGDNNWSIAANLYVNGTCFS